MKLDNWEIYYTGDERDSLILYFDDSPIATVNVPDEPASTGALIPRQAKWLGSRL